MPIVGVVPRKYDDQVGDPPKVIGRIVGGYQKRYLEDIGPHPETPCITCIPQVRVSGGHTLGVVDVLDHGKKKENARSVVFSET